MDYTNLIPWGISLVMLIFSIMTYNRNGQKDSNQELSGIKESILKANMKLDQVCATTNETRSDIKSMNRDIAEIERRVSLLENKVEAMKGE